MSPSVTDWIVAALTFILALIAGVQAYIYNKQAFIMRQQAELTRDSLELIRQSNETASKSLNLNEDIAKRQLRAYVNLDGANIISKNFSTNHEIIYSYKNFGSTPATYVSHFGRWCIFPIDAELPLLDKSECRSRGTISPGQTIPSEFKFQISEQQVQAIQDGRVYMFLYGEIEYLDVFGKSHLTKYKLIHGKDFGWGKNEMVQAYDGNEST